MKVYAVIHITNSYDMTRAQAEVAVAAGADGVALISHEGYDHITARQLRRCKTEPLTERPFQVGANFLTTGPVSAAIMAENREADFVWSDRPFPAELRKRTAGSVPLLFGPCAFKYQRTTGTLAEQVFQAVHCADVLVTSGDATGVPPYVHKLRDIHACLERQPFRTPELWCASGADAESIPLWAPYVDGVLVATSVSRTFHEIDPDKLARLVAVAHALKKEPSA